MLATAPRWTGLEYGEGDLFSKKLEPERVFEVRLSLCHLRESSTSFEVKYRLEVEISSALILIKRNNANGKRYIVKYCNGYKNRKSGVPQAPPTFCYTSYLDGEDG